LVYPITVFDSTKHPVSASLSRLTGPVGLFSPSQPIIPTRILAVMITANILRACFLMIDSPFVLKREKNHRGKDDRNNRCEI
jgi:hypothetical protein